MLTGILLALGAVAVIALVMTVALRRQRRRPGTLSKPQVSLEMRRWKPRQRDV
jgi:hypothetical protein